MATDSCRDGWNVPNCLSSHAQVFRDRWNVQQIGDGWNIRNFLNMNSFEIGWNLNMNTPEFALSELLEQKLCVSGKTHVDVIVLVAWVVFVWFVVCYVWLIELGCIRRRCGMNILNFGLYPLYFVYMKFLMT